MDYEGRVEKLQRVLLERELLYALGTSAENVRYFSGYFGFTQSPASLLVPRKGSPTLLVVEDDIELAESLSPFEARTYPLASNRFQLMTEGIARLLHGGEMETGRVGLEFDALTVSQFELCRSTLRGFTFENISSEVIRLRMIKDHEEISNFREAAGIAVRAARTGVEMARAQISEIAIKAAMEQAVFSEGASHLPEAVLEAEVNVVAGPKMNRLHALATGRRIQQGEAMFLIEGVACDGYWANIGRTVVVSGGKGHSRLQTLVEQATEAQHAALSRLAPGISLTRAVSAADETLERHGLGGRRIYPILRGLGLSKSERPGLQDAASPTEAGMCFCVQVYVRSDDIIVGRTDSILVTGDGVEVLTGSVP